MARLNFFERMEREIDYQKEYENSENTEYIKEYKNDEKGKARKIAALRSMYRYFLKREKII